MSTGKRIFVNAEENSVCSVFPDMVFPWNVTAEVQGGGAGGMKKETSNHE
jgi:hypothetical protein